MKICIAGKNQIAVNAIYYLVDELEFDKNSIYVCPSKTDNVIDTWRPSLKLAAVNKGIKIVSLKDIYNIKNLIFMSLEFDRIIKTGKFKTNKLFNIHFSLLPQYKGMYTSVLPILYGDDYSGVTLHKIDNGIDTGPILDQKKISIGINDTARDLYLKYLKEGYKLFTKNMLSIINNNYEVSPQKHLNSTYFSKSSLDFANININLNKTSFEIHNQIRAFIFREYQLPKIGNKKIKKSILTSEIIGRNRFISKNNKLIISGVDGYKVELEVT